MRAPQELQAPVTAETVKIQDDRLILQAQLRLELPMPKQDADLPRRLEAGIERGGQILKRRLFQHAVEQADAELILAQRHGKQGRGILCRGTTPFTFKTVFGTVKVGTFSPWPLSLVDRADSLLLNVDEKLGSNLNALRELRPSYCRCVHW